MKSKTNTIVAILLKGTKLFKAIKVLKPIKVMLTLCTMMISVFTYSFMMGWMFSLGFVLLLLVHELGHVAAAKRMGIPATAPVFIPFLGAAIFIPKIECRASEAFMAMGGPLIGTLGALVCLGIYYATGSTHPILFMVAYTGLFLNLFNLIPISPLDGGRITQVVSPWFKVLGAMLLFVVTLWAKDPSMIFIWMLVANDFIKRLRLQVVVLGIMYATLLLLFAFDVGQRPTWEKVVYVMLGTIYFALFFLRLKAIGDSSDEDVTHESQRAYPARSVSMRWLTAYCSIAGLLVGCMHYLKPVATALSHH